MKNHFFGLALLVILVQIVSACTSSTRIDSSPSGAKLYIDGALVGTTPFVYSDTKIIGSTTFVKLSKPGCADTSYTMTRSEEFQVGPCIGGVFIGVPFLWVMGYKPERTLELNCK